MLDALEIRRRETPWRRTSQAVTKQDLVEMREATKLDLANMREATKLDLADMREATKKDLANMREATKLDLADMREATKKDLAAVREATKKDLANMREDLATKKDLADVRQDLATKKDLADVRQDLTAAREATKQEFVDMREATRQEFVAVRSDMAQMGADVRHTQQAVAELDTRLTGEVRSVKAAVENVAVHLEQDQHAPRHHRCRRSTRSASSMSSSIRWSAPGSTAGRRGSKAFDVTCPRWTSGSGTAFSRSRTPFAGTRVTCNRWWAPWPTCACGLIDAILIRWSAVSLSWRRSCPGDAVSETSHSEARRRRQALPQRFQAGDRSHRTAPRAQSRRRARS